MGIPRVLEALQANDWTQAAGLGDVDDDAEDFGSFEDAIGSRAGKTGGDGEFDPESLDFGFDAADFEGLRQAIWDSGREAPDTDKAPSAATAAKTPNGTAGETNPRPDDEELDDGEVLKLERMMRKLQAVRDMSAGLTEEQRKRLAARAVGEVMNEL